MIKDNEIVTGAELLVPEALSRHSEVRPELVAACLSLQLEEISIRQHKPLVASVGLPFLVVELASRDALRRCLPNLQGLHAVLPRDGAVSVYAYTQAIPEEGCHLYARMFTSIMTENPAMGSVTAAVSALLAYLRHENSLSLTERQGVDMGRPALLSSSYGFTSGTPSLRVSGNSVMVMEGVFHLY